MLCLLTNILYTTQSIKESKTSNSRGLCREQGSERSQVNDPRFLHQAFFFGKTQEKNHVGKGFHFDALFTACRGNYRNTPFGLPQTTVHFDCRRPRLHMCLM